MLQRNQSSRGIAVMFTVISAGTSVAQVYNAIDDFSITQNPNGAWSYGWTQSLGAAFNLYTLTDPHECPGCDAWCYTHDDCCPYVSHNTTDQSIECTGRTIPPGALFGHPGPGGQYPVLHWTAAHDGPADISAAFEALDITTTDVHVLHNNVSLFSAVINGQGDSETFVDRVDVSAGDHLDLAVGFGSNGDYYYDTTGMDLIISLGPPPCLGDLNENGTISLADLAILLAHFGGPGASFDGDLDGDGDIDFRDLTILLANFGATCP